MTAVHEVFGVKVQIYRRSKSPFWWCSTTVGGERHRTSTGKEDYDQAALVAEAWALKLKGVERWGGGLKKAKRPFEVAAKQFLDEFEVLTQGERSPQYVALHRGRLKNHLLPYFGETDITEISSGMIYNYRIHRMKTGPLPRGPKSKDASPANRPAKAGPSKRLGRSTLHQEMVCLRQILKAEVRRGTLTSLPDTSAPHKLSGKTEHRAWFSPAEYTLLYNTTRDQAQTPPNEKRRHDYEDLHDCVLFLGNCGLRPDEALRLELRDVSIETDREMRQRILTIEVRGKVGYGPCKSMPGAVVPFQRLIARRTEQLRTKLRLAGHPDAARAKLDPATRLFPRFHRDLFNQTLHAEQLKTDREGRPRTFYSLRHTYICMRLLAGANAYELAKNCRTSVEMIQEHYAVHLKNYINTSLVNIKAKKSKPAKKTTSE
jgi:integrase